ncbi:NUDIX domain-containing protein [Synechococcales cyanobacterium C]|uniref:NUDIX domain-containing protein n=1 Tax=Petrachloros mirabilis ULC683 TaxID=2781853 RepID=A0A8K2A1U8_9CYAN|nr:NUDIX hydrolase [Petrachloros mirabilis]NCJ07942.1 NUDIX domain-containing protein [Petrachloros mirabilis ULC683]
MQAQPEPLALEVAIAILHQDDCFLMQLRDNIPTIIHPGVWGLFGGHLEPGETPENALRRELGEEISYRATTLVAFGQYSEPRVTRHVFVGALDIELKYLRLKEGWDFALLPPEAIRQGYYYSAKAKQSRPLGRPHQQILMDFLCQH